MHVSSRGWGVIRDSGSQELVIALPGAIDEIRPEWETSQVDLSRFFSPRAPASTADLAKLCTALHLIAPGAIPPAREVMAKQIQEAYARRKLQVLDIPSEQRGDIQDRTTRVMRKPPAPESGGTTVRRSNAGKSFPGQIQEGPKKCAWKDCRNHPPELADKYSKQYEGDQKKAKLKHGATPLGKRYSEGWPEEGLEPWTSGGPGRPDQGKRPLKDRYQSEIKKSPDNDSLIERAIGKVNAGGYETQKHHLIPVVKLGSYPVLVHNATLLGFNVNDSRNGICLPYFVTDIFRHNLQYHRSDHPDMYYVGIGDGLEIIEQECISFCGEGRQSLMLDDLYVFMERVKGFILEWAEGWELRSTARADRERSFKEAGHPVPKLPGETT